MAMNCTHAEFHLHIVSGSRDKRYIYTQHDSCDLYLSLSELEVDGVRYNKDVPQNRSSYTRKLLDVCIDYEVCIFNGRLGEDFKVEE